jgi:hypothetical protein
VAPDEAGGAPDVPARQDEPLAVVLAVVEEAVVDGQGRCAEPADRVEDGVLLDRERQGERGDAAEEPPAAAGVDGGDEHGEGGETERRDERVPAHEPRVVEQRGIEREKARERGHREVREAVAKEERGEREEAAEDGDDEAHAEIGRAEDVEDDAVDVVMEGAVDDGAVLDVAGLDVAGRPVDDAGLVPVGDPGAEVVETGDHGEDGDIEDDDVDGGEAEPFEEGGGPGPEPPGVDCRHCRGV